MWDATKTLLVTWHISWSRLWRPWKVSKMAGKVGFSDYIVTHVYFMGGLKGRYEMRMNNVQ